MRKTFLLHQQTLNKQAYSFASLLLQRYLFTNLPCHTEGEALEWAVPGLPSTSFFVCWAVLAILYQIQHSFLPAQTLTHYSNRYAQKKADEMKAISLQSAIDTVEKLEIKLTEFAKVHRDEIQNDPVFRQRFLQMCAPLGVDPLASKKSFCLLHDRHGHRRIVNRIRPSET